MSESNRRQKRRAYLILCAVVLGIAIVMFAVAWHMPGETTSVIRTAQLCLQTGQTHGTGGNPYPVQVSAVATPTCQATARSLNDAHAVNQWAAKLVYASLGGAGVTLWLTRKRTSTDQVKVPGGVS